MCLLGVLFTVKGVSSCQLVSASSELVVVVCKLNFIFFNHGHLVFLLSVAASVASTSEVGLLNGNPILSARIRRAVMIIRIIVVVISLLLFQMRLHFDQVILIFHLVLRQSLFHRLVNLRPEASSV